MSFTVPVSLRLQRMSTGQQKTSLGKFCFIDARMNFIRNLEREKTFDIAKTGIKIIWGLVLYWPPPYI